MTTRNNKLSSIHTLILEQIRSTLPDFDIPVPFISGKTYLPPSAKSLAWADLEAGVEAALDWSMATGPRTLAFEQALSEYLGSNLLSYAVNSGSSANLVALTALADPDLDFRGMRPLQKGDEVITTAVSYPTTVNPILQNGWLPVFVDIDAKTMNATPEIVWEAVTSKTRAIVLAHTLGNPFRADLLASKARERGIFLVEDCCDALGSTLGVEKRKVGTYGDYATFSFYPAHHITLGEGGAVSSAPSLGKIVQRLRDGAGDSWETSSFAAYELGITDIQAAIGISQLNRLPNFIERRRQNWKKIYDGIRASPVLNERLSPVEPTASSDPSWFGFPLYCREGISREGLVIKLEAAKIGTRPVFAGNITRQPAYRNLKYRVVGDLKASDAVLKQAFWMGVHPRMEAGSINYLLEQLEGILSRF